MRTSVRAAWVTGVGVVFWRFVSTVEIFVDNGDVSSRRTRSVRAGGINGAFVATLGGGLSFIVLTTGTDGLFRLCCTTTGLGFGAMSNKS